MNDAGEAGGQAGRRLRVAYVAQLAPPPSLDLGLFCRLQGGWDETEAFRALVDLLGHGDSVEVIGVHADRGESPALDYDAVVLGGSFASVNDGHDWQRRLLGWLDEWRQTGRPMLGICGGHQLAALALGGNVARREDGPVVGTLATDLTEAGRGHWLFADMGEAPLFQFAHFDHVTQLPAGSTVLATRDGTIAALDFGGEWVSTQFHPETTGDRLATYWNSLITEESSRFYFLSGCERLIGNFLERAVALKGEETA